MTLLITMTDGDGVESVVTPDYYVAVSTGRVRASMKESTVSGSAPEVVSLMLRIIEETPEEN